MKKIVFIGFVCVLAIYSIPPSAFSFEFIERNFDKIGKRFDAGSLVGMGVMIAESPYKGVSTDAQVLPIFMVKKSKFFIDRTTLGYKVINTDDGYSVAIIGAPRFAGYHSSDSSDLAGMDDRERSFDGGLEAKWKTDLCTVSAKVLTDLLSKHDGQEISLSISKSLFKGFLKPRLSASWLSQDYVDYYYGVKSTETTAARSAYNGQSTVNYNVGVMLALPLGKKWALIADVNYQFLGSQIEDSPIVNESSLMRYAAGLVYRF